MKRFIVYTLIGITTLSAGWQGAVAQMTNTVPADIRSRLVELAIQNPNMETTDHQINIAQYELKGERNWWLQNIGLSFNLNEFTVKRITKKKGDNAFYPFYPIYNFAINIPIGTIFTSSNRIRAASERVAIAKNAKTDLFNQIKTEVLTTYEDYLANRELLALQNQSTESAYNNLLQAKEKFRNGEVTLIEYNIADEAYNAQMKQKINAQRTLNLTKIKLEGMIGTSLESVTNNQK